MLEKHRSALTSRNSVSVKENPVTLADLKELLVDEGENLSPLIILKKNNRNY
jgi:hypothetical protein